MSFDKKNIKFKGIFLLIIAAIFFVSISFLRKTYKNYKINKEIENLKSKIESLKDENLELSSLINHLETDNFVEKEARLKFGLKKEGENVFIIDKKNKNAINNIMVEEKIKQISCPAQWVNYFFGIN